MIIVITTRNRVFRGSKKKEPYKDRILDTWFYIISVTQNIPTFLYKKINLTYMKILSSYLNFRRAVIRRSS